jgi:hypothetical protein
VKLSRHRLDAVSFGFGVAFLAAAALWVVASVISIQPATVGWLLAGALLVLGGLGVAQTLRSGSDPDDPEG